MFVEVFLPPTKLHQVARCQDGELRRIRRGRIPLAWPLRPWRDAKGGILSDAHNMGKGWEMVVNSNTWEYDGLYHSDNGGDAVV